MHIQAHQYFCIYIFLYISLYISILIATDSFTFVTNLNNVVTHPDAWNKCHPICTQNELSNMHVSFAYDICE